MTVRIVVVTARIVVVTVRIAVAVDAVAVEVAAVDVADGTVVELVCIAVAVAVAGGVGGPAEMIVKIVVGQTEHVARCPVEEGARLALAACAPASFSHNQNGMFVDAEQA